MKKFLLLVFFFIINYSLFVNHCFSQWVQQSVPITETGGIFWDMKFANANTGFISHSSGVVLKTTDAGNNWFVNKYGRMFSISIIDGKYVYGSSELNTNGFLYKSTDLGITWDSLLYSPEITYGYLYFFNKDTGLINGWNSDYYVIYRTTDGGLTKQVIEAPSGIAGKYFFLKEKINGEYYGWMYYPGSNFVYRTSNSGLNWISLPNFPGLNYIDGFFFINKDTGWYTIENPENIFYYTNDGLNWTSILMSYFYNYLSEIWFVNSNTGWIGTTLSQKIFKTTDGGNTWGTQNINGTSSYGGPIFFIDSVTGWVQTSWNKLAHTTNGGGPITTVNNLTLNIPDNFILYQNFPNPFNATTNINFFNNKKSFIIIKIYNITGKEIETLTNKEYKPGEYSLKWDANNYSSGVYFYRIEAGDFTNVKKMILIK